MKRLFYGIFLFLLILVFPRSIYAEYVLPYPSYMPGNKLYTISRIFDRVKQYWYWGDIGGFRYHLALSDKYIVEAKTLFEYKQYLLAVDALRRSDREFSMIPQFLDQAKKNGKDTTQMKNILLDASYAHKILIEGLIQDTPETFLWSPEKTLPINLELHTLLRHSKAAL